MEKSGIKYTEKNSNEDIMNVVFGIIKLMKSNTNFSAIVLRSMMSEKEFENMEVITDLGAFYVLAEKRE